MGQNEASAGMHRRSSSAGALKIGRLHVLTDFLFQQRFSHYELARMAIEGGADTIQFRQKAGAIRHKLHAARETALVCKQMNTPLIVDDHLDIMLAVNAEGIHLGRTDFPVRDARRILGPNKIIGATANSMKEALAAGEEGVDYIGFGPIYHSTSKANLASIQGIETLREVCAAVVQPVIAIAGITVDRVEEVFEAGAHGIAVMTAVSTQDDPLASTRAFRDAIDKQVGTG